MIVTHTTGDLVQAILDNKYGSFAHGCNCFHTMGKGIAKDINEATEGLALETDMETSYGDINKLGSFSVFTYNSLTIFNLYTQYTYSNYFGVKVHWESVQRSLTHAIMHSYRSNHYYLAIPVIGCGLAGGDIADFYRVINDIEKNFKGYYNDFQLVVVEYN